MANFTFFECSFSLFFENYGGINFLIFLKKAYLDHLSGAAADRELGMMIGEQASVPEIDFPTHIMSNVYRSNKKVIIMILEFA